MSDSEESSGPVAESLGASCTFRVEFCNKSRTWIPVGNVMGRVPAGRLLRQTAQENVGSECRIVMVTRVESVCDKLIILSEDKDR